MAITRANDDLNGSRTDHSHSNTAINEAVREAAPMLKRASVHRDRIGQAVRELETEKSELLTRLDHLRRQFEAAEHGLAHQIEDVEATLKLYEHGLNSVALRTN
jgi:predicted transcriptional regulator